MSGCLETGPIPVLFNKERKKERKKEEKGRKKEGKKGKKGRFSDNQDKVTIRNTKTNQSDDGGGEDVPPGHDDVVEARVRREFFLQKVVISQKLGVVGDPQLEGVVLCAVL